MSGSAGAGVPAGQDVSVAVASGGAGAPRGDAVDLDVDREAEDGADDDQKSQRDDSFEGEGDGHGADQVGGDEDLQAGEQPAAEGAPARHVGAGRTGRPVG